MVGVWPVAHNERHKTHMHKETSTCTHTNTHTRATCVGQMIMNDLE